MKTIVMTEAALDLLAGKVKIMGEGEQIHYKYEPRTAYGVITPTLQVGLSAQKTPLKKIRLDEMMASRVIGMLKSGLDAKAIAKQTGVSYHTIWRIATGRHARYRL